MTIKGKILQLTLPDEVSTDRSLAQCNTTTGHLLVTMPRLQPLARISAPISDTKKTKSAVKSIRAEPEVSRREYLEIGPPREEFEDMLMVLGKEKTKEKKVEKDEEFVDDPSVPPLE